jgi:hypothetical protein
MLCKIPRRRFLEGDQSLTTKGLDALRDVLSLALLELGRAGTIVHSLATDPSSPKGISKLERKGTLTLP